MSPEDPTSQMNFLSSSEGATDRRSMHVPLAERMRPDSMEDFIGQERVMGENSPLRRWIESDRLPSLILWGPPGSGKTTLAQVISKITKARFEKLSAVHSGVKDLKELIASVRSRTILFIDEIHRFNKSQQDALLPAVEAGTVTLIGATTENPSFELNQALLSRTRVIRMDPLSEESIVKILRRSLQNPEKGLGGILKFDDEALAYIASLSEGDARRSLTLLENITQYLSVESSRNLSDPVSTEEVKSTIERTSEKRILPYDKSGEEHYNVISAFIKSIRGSDPHAALYYLARMISAGEDPVFIARRLVILASEDIGNADPRALQLAISVKDAVELVGMPEGRIPLGQGVTYLAMAPKSNASYMGIEEALAEVEKSGALPVPFHLRNAVTSLMKKEGYGKGYQYAHDKKDARVKQHHLPEALKGKRFYAPKDAGLEKQIKEKLDLIQTDFE